MNTLPDRSGGTPPRTNPQRAPFSQQDHPHTRNAMNEQEIIARLEQQAPNGYRLNELIPFAHPVRKVALRVLVNRQPDDSLTGIYAVLLQGMEAGLRQEQELLSFLGIPERDEFLGKELMFLRNEGYAQQLGGAWNVLPKGNTFMRDNSTMREEAEEEFTFLIDGITGEPFSMAGNGTQREVLKKWLAPELTPTKKSPELLHGCSEGIAELCRQQSKGQSLLIGYADDGIRKDFEEWLHRYLVEYVPESGSTEPPVLEVRCMDANTSLDRRLTRLFNERYEEFIYRLTDSDRGAVMQLPEAGSIVQAPTPTPTRAKQAEKPMEEELEKQSEKQPGTKPDHQVLTIFETERMFVEAMDTARERLLIESPWVKRAMDAHIGRLRRLLERECQLYILYGISAKDEHDERTLRKLRDLRDEFPEFFKLAHLPAHFARIGKRMDGTHRKLVLKDHEYSLSGSFNFMSLAGTEGRKVANEEATCIRSGVKERWERIFKEYRVDSLP